MSTAIENQSIAELAETLAAAIPSPDSIREAMALASRMGKADGALEIANRMLSSSAVSAA
jgi:hypothetical protein